MGHVVITEFMDEPAIDWLRENHDVTYDPDLVDDAERLRKVCAIADGLIVRNRTKVDRALIEAAPGLRVIGRLGVGLDNIDTEFADERQIKVCPATGGNVVSVAEYVVTAILVLRRAAWMGTSDVLAGSWPRQTMIGYECAGSCLGLVGYGAIAQASAERARAMGMTIIAYDPFLPEDHPAWQTAERHEALETLLSEADAVSLHVPLTETTRGLFSSERLAMMKSSAVLINTARGQIVDEDALAKALKTGSIGGAAMDVFANEPLASANALAGVPNLIATPHIAGVTVESNTRISWITVQNVARYLET